MVHSFSMYEVQHVCYLIGYGCAEACVSILLMGNSHGQDGSKDQNAFMQMMLKSHAQCRWDQYSIIVKSEYKMMHVQYIFKYKPCCYIVETTVSSL